MSSTDALRFALEPRSIALIGASENPNKIGGRPLLYLQRFGYRGRIYPINPNRAEVQGVKSYADLASLPEAPDLAIVMVAGDGAVEMCRNAPSAASKWRSAWPPASPRPAPPARRRRKRWWRRRAPMACA